MRREPGFAPHRSQASPHRSQASPHRSQASPSRGFARPVDFALSAAERMETPSSIGVPWQSGSEREGNVTRLD